jgi:hypothetical protein
MNWIEIDKILYAIILRHTALDDIYAEAEKQFTWSRSQSMAAIDPILERLNWKDDSGLPVGDSNSAILGTTSKGRKVRNKSKTIRK